MYNKLRREKKKDKRITMENILKNLSQEKKILLKKKRKQGKQIRQRSTKNKTGETSSNRLAITM